MFAMEKENVALGSYTEVFIEDGFYVLKIQNDTHGIQRVTREIDSTFIQFHFCLKGHAKFIFNAGRYALEVSEENSLLLYNTQIDLPMNMEMAPNSWMVSIVMTIRKFHSLFSKEADYIPFLSTEVRYMSLFRFILIKVRMLIWSNVLFWSMRIM